MTKIILLILMLVISQPKEVPLIWSKAKVESNYKILTAVGLECSKWVGCPDPNYIWDGERLRKKTRYVDEDGKKQVGVSYREPIEIIADFNPETKVLGIAGNIEKAVVKKFGGALKGFIWLDNVSGSGEVILPFTAPHIFIARGDRLNPELTEISTDSKEDNYYEVVEGKTRVFVKSFSGIGGAAGAPPTLIAHYKMNENTAGDNDELVINGDFANWTDDNPDDWSVDSESAPDREISEVGAGEGHGGAGTGMCNIYSTGGYVALKQIITVVVGRKYRISVDVNTVIDPSLEFTGGSSPDPDRDFILSLSEVKTYTTTFVATASTVLLSFKRRISACDVTFDNVSVKLCAVEDSSVNDHDGLLQEDTDAAHVAGKINGAFDFDGAADYIEIADHADFTPALTPFSISAWVYMHDATGFGIASKGDYNVDGEFWFYIDANDKLRFILFDESVASCYIGRRYDTVLTSYENQWIHLVGTYDGGITSASVKLYLNGVRADDANQEINPASFVAVENLTHAAWIGRYQNIYANGLIDNVMFFSVELTQDEVNILYNAGSGTEIPAELDSKISPRRSNLSPLPLRRRYEF